MIQFYTKHPKLMLTAAFALLLLGSCAKDPAGADGPGAGADIALYIPAPERVETYSGATIDECRIDNAVVLACKDGRITGAEVVDIILGNGTQQPTLRFRKLAPVNGETIVVLCNLDPATVGQAAGLIGETMATAQNRLKPRSAAAAAGGTAADMKVPLTMAGEGVWDGQNRSAQVRMTFQCAKISVVLEPSLTAEGGALAWTATRSTYLDRMPACSNWKTASTQLLQNELGTLSQSSTPGYDPTADPMSFPALYTYEAAMPANWPTNRALNYVLLRVADANGNPAQYYCLTYDQTDQGRITAYRPFERGKHYVFRVKDIYKRGYDNIDEALDNPSNAVYEIDVSDDWSKNWEYNGQYAVTADRDTAYVWTTTEAQPLYRFSWPQPEGDPDGAPATSTVRLLAANKTSTVSTTLVQLLDKNQQPITNNTFTFNGQPSPEEGYQFSFRTAANVTTPQGMWLHVKCGNIERFVPVGWATFSAQDITATYTGGDFTSAIVSQAAMPDGTNKVVPWEAEYVNANGNKINKPDWITDATPPEGPVTVNIAPQKNSAVFRPGSAVSNYDLSTKGGTTPINTANCYIVNAPGTYTLPLVYGNAIKNGQTNESAYTSTATGTYVLTRFLNHLGLGITDPYIYNNKTTATGNVNITLTDAKLLWQDLNGLIDETSVTTDGKNLTFQVTENIDYGNAVLAVFDSQGQIAWSWHIWATSYDPYVESGTITVQNRSTPRTELDFMTQNLGWCPGGEEYEGREARIKVTQPLTGEVRTITLTQIEHKEAFGSCTYFQWGRKDPMPGILGNAVNKPTYGPAAYIWPSTGTTAGSQTFSTTSIAEYIKNPYKYSLNSWMENKYYNLWDANVNYIVSTNYNTNPVVKTIYDPSPVGFVMPPSGAFTGFTSTGGDVSSLANMNVRGAFEFGYYFYCRLNRTGSAIYMPNASRAQSTSGVYWSSNGYYWTAHAYSTSRGKSFAYSTSSLTMSHYYHKGDGYNLRSIKE